MRSATPAPARPRGGNGSQPNMRVGEKQSVTPPPITTAAGRNMLPVPQHYDQACPVAKALELVGDRWTLLIVRDLLNEETCRFQDFQQSLKGIALAILSDRLYHM